MIEDEKFSFTAKLIFLVILPIIIIIISMLLSLITLVIFYKNKNLRLGTAGNIKFFILIIEEIFLGLCFLSIFYDSSLNDNVCRVLATTTILIAYSIQYLNFALSISLLIILKSNSVQDIAKRKKFYSFLTIFMIFIFSILLMFFDELKFGPIGMCWLNGSRKAEIINFISTVFIYPLSIFTMIYLKSHQEILKETCKEDEENNNYFLYKNFIFVNSGYLLIFNLTWIPINLVYLTNIWNQFHQFDQNSKFYSSFKQTAFFFLVISPIFMFFLRMKENIFRVYLKNMHEDFKYFILNKRKSETNLSSLNEDYDDFTIKSESIYSQKLLTEKPAEDFIPVLNERCQIQDLSKKRRTISLFFKEKNVNDFEKIFAKIFLGTYFVLFKEKIDHEVEKNKNTMNYLMLEEENFEEEYDEEEEKKEDRTKIKQSKSLVAPPWELYYYNEIEMKQLKVKEILKEISENNKNEKELMKNYDKILKSIEDDNMACFIFGKIFFNKIMKIYNVNIEDTMKSFDINENINNIKLLAEIKRFQNIITEDKKFVVKIIDKKSKIFLINNFLVEFHVHIFENNYLSFINPILGLFSLQLNEKTNINIAFIKNQSFKAKFEFIFNEKGIIQIKFNEKGKLIKKIKHAYKNFKLDLNLKIKFKDQARVMKIITKDTTFLMKMKQINYKIHFVLYDDPENRKTQSRNIFHTTSDKYFCKLFINNFEDLSKNNKKLQGFLAEDSELYGNSLIETIQHFLFA